MARRAPLEVPFRAALLGFTLFQPTAWTGAVAQRAAMHPTVFRSGSAQRPLKLTFRQSLVGVDGEGRCVWLGRAEGEAQGRLTVALQQVESPFLSAEPVWHVRSRWTLDADTSFRSFSAELEGMVDWKAGVAHMSGVVTEGWMKGAWVQVTYRLVDLEASGDLRITAVLASR